MRFCALAKSFALHGAWSRAAKREARISFNDNFATIWLPRGALMKVDLSTGEVWHCRQGELELLGKLPHVDAAQLPVK
jgi:hypothetical protein